MEDLYDISVIIPAHNEEKYVKRCIDSVKQADSLYTGKTEIIVLLSPTEEGR